LLFVFDAQGSTDLDHIQIIKKQGGKLTDSYLDEGFILDKKMGVNCPHRMENVKILIANTRQSPSSQRITTVLSNWSSYASPRSCKTDSPSSLQLWTRTRSRSSALVLRSTRLASLLSLSGQSGFVLSPSIVSPFG
jgi:hypothetical protein